MVIWNLPSGKLTVRPCQLSGFFQTGFHYKIVIFSVELLIYQKIIPGHITMKIPLYGDIGWGPRFDTVQLPKKMVEFYGLW